MVRGVHKIYLSAILDLYDRRIVSYVISDHNDNPIVFDTFKATVKANPDAHPLQSCAVPSTVPTVMPGTTVADFI